MELQELQFRMEFPSTPLTLTSECEACEPKQDVYVSYAMTLGIFIMVVIGLVILYKLYLKPRLKMLRAIARRKSKKEMVKSLKRTAGALKIVAGYIQNTMFLV